MTPGGVSAGGSCASMARSICARRSARYSASVTTLLLPIRTLRTAPRAAVPSRPRESSRSFSPPPRASDCRSGRGGCLPRRAAATRRAAAPPTRGAARFSRAAERLFRIRSRGCGPSRALRRPRSLDAERLRLDCTRHRAAFELHFDLLADADGVRVEDRLAAAARARERDRVAAREDRQRLRDRVL